MRKIITILALGMIVAMCHGQVSNPSIVSVTTAPSGSCQNGLPNRQVLSTGAQYSCQSGTWGEIGGGGGAIPCTTTANGVQYNNSGAFGCDADFTFDPTTKVLTAGGYATSPAYQGVLSLTQNATAAPSSPANTFRLLAPQSGLTSSYDIIVPQLAPVSANSAMVCPIGGGQCTWGAAGSDATSLQGTDVSGTAPTDLQYLQYIAADSAWEPTTFTGVSLSSANTFTAAQTISTSGNPGLIVTSSSTGAAGFDVVNTSSGGKGFRIASSGSSNTNGPGLLFITDLTDPGTPLIGVIRPITTSWPSIINVRASAAFSAYVSSGAVFSASGCSANSLVGGSTAGSLVSGTTGTCTVTITTGNAIDAPNGYSCWFNDLTTPADVLHQTDTTTTTVTFSGTTVTGDAINFGCMGY